jgi:uncharacterized protein (DUF58 family)
MSVDGGRTRPGRSRSLAGRLSRGLVQALWPTQRLIWTREGGYYLLFGLGLLFTGLYQQINLILLVSTLAAGPLVSSIFVSAAMLRRLRVTRRTPPYVFSGDPLEIDYTLENGRRWTAALALSLEDAMIPVDRAIPGAASQTPRAFFARVPGRGISRQRWRGSVSARGRYSFRDLDLITRSPFGLLERRVTIDAAGGLIVYPKVGRLTRRWMVMQRQVFQNRQGRRHDRSAQQEEYHGLRDYRSGDSSRWIHWRTSARRGELMVKEFEQQQEQDLAILIDPWLPRTKVSAEQREAIEQAIRFAATVCLETCRRQGRRLVVGWTGTTPGIRQGPSSVKLLHELLDQLAVLRPTSEGTLAELFDAMPPSMLREAAIVILSTRPVNLIEEAERSARLAGTAARGMLSRAILLNSASGDLDDLIEFNESSTSSLLEQRIGPISVSPHRSAAASAASPISSDPAPDQAASLASPRDGEGLGGRSTSDE